MMNFILIFLISVSSYADSIFDAVDSNKQGVAALKKQNPVEAQAQFSKAIGQAPFMPELQINLALAYDQLGNLDKAKQAYHSAEKLSLTKDAQFVLNFNLAEIEGRDKQIDSALSYYQKALEAHPDSIEAKTNIELLIQQNQQQQKSGKDGKDKDDKKDQDKKDDKNQNDKKDQDQKKPGESQKKDEHHQKNKPQPRPFKSEELTPGDVKKILEEMDRQEQRVRAEYNKKQVKEKPRDKDW